MNNGVHSVFNEIAHLKPTTSSSSDEDDKNLIMSWELNEHNFDTLPSSPGNSIKHFNLGLTYRMNEYDIMINTIYLSHFSLLHKARS